MKRRAVGHLDQVRRRSPSSRGVDQNLAQAQRLRRRGSSHKEDAHVMVSVMPL